MNSKVVKFTCGKHQPIRQGIVIGHREIIGASDAAFIFATREARGEYGRRGFCHHVRRDSWREDGSTVTFEAFIGVPWDCTGCQGHNIWLTVGVHSDRARGSGSGRLSG